MISALYIYIPSSKLKDDKRKNAIRQEAVVIKKILDSCKDKNGHYDLGSFIQLVNNLKNQTYKVHSGIIIDFSYAMLKLQVVFDKEEEEIVVQEVLSVLNSLCGKGKFEYEKVVQSK